MKRLAVLCSGNGSNFEAILTAIRRKRLRAEVAVMVSDNPSAYAVTRAKNHGVPVVVLPSRLFASRKEHETLIVSVLKQLEVDLVVLAGYMRIFTPYFIRSFRGRIVNIHPSLLPAHKGVHAIRDAFQAGARKTGVTVHVVTAELDAGPVIAQSPVKCSARETLASLEKKIHRTEHALYPRAIETYLKKLT